MEKEFKYKVTVIVPVYNAEEYIENCLNSLVSQTMDINQIEVLMINDGSSDNSLNILNGYASIYPSFHVITQENAGPSSARNRGLCEAEGKYIMFLDSDDTYSKDAVKLVTDFFDIHYDEIDLISLYDQYYKNGKPLAPHVRYKFLKETGIYDLEKTIWALQVRLSICIKNRFEDNLLFDDNIKYQEDQYFCCQILKDKMKMGFVKNAVYNYLKNDTGIVSSNTNALTMFENSTAFFESIFHSYEKGQVPRYYQSLFIHDIIWKFESSCLWPYHYSKEDFAAARERIYSLLEEVDTDVIMGYPSADNYQKMYWLRHKKNAQVTPFLSENKMYVLSGEKNIYKRKDAEVILKRIVVSDGIIKIIGFYKSPLFALCEKPDFYILEDGKSYIPLETWLASSSYYKAKEITDSFWAFEYTMSAANLLKTDIQFRFFMDGIEFKTVFYNSPTSPFYGEIKKYSVASENVIISQSGSSIVLEKASTEACKELVLDNCSHFAGKRNMYNLRLMAYSCLGRNIWLYYDDASVDYDNGYFQFIHDFVKNDGIERYYVLFGEPENFSDLFKEEHLPWLVQYGSTKHKILYLNAAKLLTAFIEDFTLNPFGVNEQYKYNDLFHAEIIYLQHGVLHAHLPWYYSPLNVAVDKVVVSSEFEVENFSRNYGFVRENLLPFGAPRYQMLDPEKAPEKRIIFAPSWRNYLIGKPEGFGGKRAGNFKHLEESSYYSNIMKFLNNKRLIEYLEQNDIFLDVKLHPKFYQVYSEYINFESSHISLSDNEVDLTRYSVFITDISSYVYDFAYLKRPILYFVPDYIEFISGMNHYRKLDLPFSEAFGPLTTDPEDAVDEIIRICENNFTAEPEYFKRLDNFFLPMDSPTEDLYNYLIGKE